MGRNYDAAVIAGGFCGLGMGATPVAIANMSAVTRKYGPSFIAFLFIADYQRPVIDGPPYMSVLQVFQTNYHHTAKTVWKHLQSA